MKHLVTAAFWGSLQAWATLRLIFVGFDWMSVALIVAGMAGAALAQIAWSRQ